MKHLKGLKAKQQDKEKFLNPFDFGPVHLALLVFTTVSLPREERVLEAGKIQEQTK